ncbi:unnamed protein product [Aphis gossypii]|uniref:Uncharacterized protein n=1 Tax=Aphis gossypii TaxID=80765 RepID=A0A9P0J3J7_APHGO|nr:unnamed protein product [Aphis gossypii]
MYYFVFRHIQHHVQKYYHERCNTKNIMRPRVQKEIVGVKILVFWFFDYYDLPISKYVCKYYIVYNKLDLYTPNYIDVENSRNALQSNIVRIIYVRIICHNQGFELDGFTYFLVAYSKSDSTQIYFKIHTTQIQKCMLHIFAYFTGIK